MNSFKSLLVCSILTGFIELAGTASAERLRFQVGVDRALAPQPVSGRLIILMTTNTAKVDVITTDWTRLRSVWCCAKEVESLAAGKPVEVDPDDVAFPTAFSQAPAGAYQIMAVLDVDHSFAYSEMGSGDLRSEVLPVEHFAPKNTKPIELTLTKRVPDRGLMRDTDSVKLVTLRSDLLSAFCGRTIEMRAGVRLPPSYRTNAAQRYPTVYVVHGFGGSYTA